MKVELNIISDPWVNFCSKIWGDNTMYLTLDSVNRELEQYNAHCLDLGEWRVFFSNQESLSFFLLKWA
jgi:hypothetical protein